MGGREGEGVQEGTERKRSREANESAGFFTDVFQYIAPQYDALTWRLTAHTRAHTRTPSEGQQRTSTPSCWQAQPNTAQHSAWQEGTGGVPPGLSADTRCGRRDAVGRYMYTYTHARRERAAGDARPNTATGATLVHTHQPTHVCSLHTLRRTRGTHRAARSHSPTREQGGSDAARHRNQKMHDA